MTSRCLSGPVAEPLVADSTHGNAVRFVDTTVTERLNSFLAQEGLTCKHIPVVDQVRVLVLPPRCRGKLDQLNYPQRCSEAVDY